MTLPLPLVPASALLDIHADTVRIVDCRFTLDDPDRGRQDHRHGHVPGAVYLSLDDDLTGPYGPGRHPLPEPNAFAATLGRAGIGNDDTVVAYDAAGGAFASRLWWMLRSLGHHHAGVLDGGWPAWLAADGPVSTDAAAHEPATFEAPDDWSGVIHGDELEQRLHEITLIDARAPERFRGEVEPLDPVAGHIPSAENLPYTENLNTDGTFRPVSELQARFGGLSGDVVAYCGSGVTACHDVLAMELAGIDGVALYPGSWSDWCSSGREVATGA